MAEQEWRRGSTLRRSVGRWLLDSAVRQGRVLLAIAEKPGAVEHRRGGEPTLTSYNRRGSLISDLIIHSEISESLSISEGIDEEGEADQQRHDDDHRRHSRQDSADMSRRQISKKEARLMRERSMTLPTPTRAEQRRFKHSGGFKKRDVRLLHMVNSVTGGLGVEITGGKGSSFGDTGIYVSHVRHGGMADRMGKLRRGDEILMVNGRSMIGMSHAEAQHYLHDLPPGPIQVVVAQVPEAWQDTGPNLFLSPEHSNGRPFATNGELSPSSQTQSPHRIQPVARTASALVDQRRLKSPMKNSISRSQSLGSTSSDEIGQVQGPKRISSTDLGEIGSRKERSSLTSLSLRGRTKSFEHVAKSRVHPMGAEEAILAASRSSQSNTNLTEGEEADSALGDLSRLTRVLSAPNVATENSPNEPNLRQEVLTKDRNAVNNAQSLTQLVSFPNTELVPITPWARFTKPGSVRKVAKKQEETIVLVKDGRGLGFTIVGGRGTQRGDLPIYVKTITVEGTAAEDGRLLVGDEILAINGQSLDGATQAEAKQIFKNVKRGIVTLEVRHRQRNTHREILITLNKEPGIGLGFSIAGVSSCKDKYDIYIQFLQEDTAAANDGQAIRGDQIVSVNGHSLESVTLDEAHASFRNLEPGPIDILLRRRTEGKVGDADKQKKQSFSAAAGQRTNSFHESARRLEKAKVASAAAAATTMTSSPVTSSPVPQSNGHTDNSALTAESFFARRPSGEIEPFLAGTGLQAPSRRSLSPEGLSPGLGRGTLGEGADVIASSQPTVAVSPPDSLSPTAEPHAAGVAGSQPAVEQKDLPEQHLKQSSSLMASLSDYFNQSISSRENSPAVSRHSSNVEKAEAPKPASPLIVERPTSMHTQLEEVTLSKVGSTVGLGMTIMGGADSAVGHIMVSDVHRAGPAHTAGIDISDQIVEVNGLTLAGMSNAAVIDLLRETRSTVRLLVAKAVPKTPTSKPTSPGGEQEKKAGPASSLTATPKRPPSVSQQRLSELMHETDGGAKSDSEPATSPPPPLPEVSPPASIPGSRVSSMIASSQQSSPNTGRVIHRRSLSSITAAGLSKEQKQSESDESDENDVSIVPMAARHSRKRTRTTRTTRSGFSGGGGGDHHDSNDSVRSMSKQSTVATPTKVEELPSRILASSPPPILPASYSAAGSLASSPLSEMILSNESLATPSRKASVDDAPGVAASTTMSLHRGSKPSPKLTKKSPSLSAKGSPRHSAKTSSRSTPPVIKSSTPPLVQPYHRSSTPTTPKKTPEAQRKSSFTSHLASGKGDSPKTPRKSSLSRMKSSPLPSRGSPKKSSPSPEMMSYTQINESSAQGSITIGKRSETGLFELQLRKSIAGLGISTQRGQDGAVLVKAAPTGKGAELRSGDQLVKVNGQDVSGMSSAEADSLLKSLPRGKVTLLVRPATLVTAKPVENGKVASPSNDDHLLGTSQSSSGLGTSVSTLESSSFDSRKLPPHSSPPDMRKVPSSVADDAKPTSVIQRDPEEGVINIETAL
eukprot:scpid12420/ scgid4822/ PDZ domain-containing protein 2; Activated in prostate cancer protein; PDZ domain-containing protein 3; Processed PDZ domain-containing protein 2